LRKSAVDEERLLLFQVLREVLAEPVKDGSAKADALLRRICLELTAKSRFICWACYIVPDAAGVALVPEFSAGLAGRTLRIARNEAGPLWNVLRDRAPRVERSHDPKAPAWLRDLGDVVAEVSLFPFGTTVIQGVGLVGVSRRGYFARLGLDYFATFTNLGNLSLCLRAQALHDPLTSLPNRALFLDRLRHACGYARRRQRLLGVALLDLDGFKHINDRHGHAAGDGLLQKVGQALRVVLRPTDTLARIGGDEFALLFVDMPCLDDIEMLCARVLEGVQSVQQTIGPGEAVALSASLGVTVFPLDEGDTDTLLLHADLALYAAKAAGRSQYRIHSFDLSMAKDAHLRVHEFVRCAMAQQRLQLYYQPVIRVTGEVVGFEALLRIVSENGEVMEASGFQDPLDAPDMARPLGCFVLEAVARQREDWARDARVASCQISLNISATHLLSPFFLEDVQTALAAHPNLDPGTMELEITESASLRDLQGVQRTLLACREMGIRTALDDFGTGYASLAYLQKLPVDTLKIDQSFVRDMAGDPKDYAIVAGIAYIAHLLELRVIAEGVETPAHVQTLKALGCMCLQGYAIARAMPAMDVPAWMAARTASMTDVGAGT
jgi:diguanylate cyclase (GGDEF)-like protein